MLISMKEKWGKLKREEEGVIGKLLHSALLVFLDQFEWFMGQKEQFRDKFKSYQNIKEIEYWTMSQLIQFKTRLND